MKIKIFIALFIFSMILVSCGEKEQIYETTEAFEADIENDWTGTYRVTGLVRPGKDYHMPIDLALYDKGWKERIYKIKDDQVVISNPYASEEDPLYTNGIHEYTTSGIRGCLDEESAKVLDLEFLEYQEGEADLLSHILKDDDNIPYYFDNLDFCLKNYSGCEVLLFYERGENKNATECWLDDGEGNYYLISPFQVVRLQKEIQEIQQNAGVTQFLWQSKKKQRIR